MISIRTLSKAVLKGTSTLNGVPSVVSISGYNYIWRDFVSPDAAKAIESIALLKVS